MLTDRCEAKKGDGKPCRNTFKVVESGVRYCNMHAPSNKDKLVEAKTKRHHLQCEMRRAAEEIVYAATSLGVYDVIGNPRLEKAVANYRRAKQKAEACYADG